MRVLLDACVPRGLRKHLPGHEVQTAPEMGWGNLDNGDLLDAMAGHFEHEATFSITPTPLRMIEGYLPARALGLVIEWATLHQRELMNDWDKARRGLSLDPIPPLE